MNHLQIYSVLDIDNNGAVSTPLLFSRILYTKNNEGFVSFSPNEKTVYYTRSSQENSNNYQLYKAILEKNSNGNWINHKQLTKNTNYSVENPCVSKDGKTLYFSSNRGDGFGCFDLYAATIKKDGSIGVPENLGNTINTKSDEKFPHFSNNGKYMFFSSNGHKGLGGYDVFVSKKSSKNFNTPKNLGQTINSKFDEVAFVYIDNNKGVFSSNKKEGKGSFDMYEFNAKTIFQNLEGIVVNENNQPLENSTVILLDEEQNEIERQVTGIDAHYRFKVKAFENYSVKVKKTGFLDFELKLSTENNDKLVYKDVLKLSSKKHAVVKK